MKAEGRHPPEASKQTVQSEKQSPWKVRDEEKGIVSQRRKQSGMRGRPPMPGLTAGPPCLHLSPGLSSLLPANTQLTSLPCSGALDRAFSMEPSQ